MLVQRSGRRCLITTIPLFDDVITYLIISNTVERQLSEHIETKRVWITEVVLSNVFWQNYFILSTQKT